ncbi:hypothetical protein N8569_00745 [bacterium]|nr:hypothetical protein [bacterium]
MSLRYLIPIALLLVACGTTPAQRCIGYTGGVARYEGMLSRGEVLSAEQQLAYDVAVAGKAATCGLPPAE